MPDAELEISIQRRITGYTADARLRSAWQQARAVAQQRGTLRLRLRLAEQLG